MKELTEKAKIIIKFLLEGISDSEKLLEKSKEEIYTKDLFDFVVDEGLNENPDFLNFIKNYPKMLYKFNVYNGSMPTDTFEQALEKMFKKEIYQDYEIEDTNLRDNLNQDLNIIRHNYHVNKISDECIAKLINTMKARVVAEDKILSLNDSPTHEYHWAPEAIVAQELLRIILPDKLELYYISPVEDNDTYHSLINTQIINQRKNQHWCANNTSFIESEDIKYYFSSERSILTDLLDFLPEIASVKFGVSINFPISSLHTRLELILYYFEKSEINSSRKELAYNIISAFYKKFIFTNGNSGIYFEKCKKVLENIKENIELSKLEEEKLTQKAKLSFKNINENDLVYQEINVTTNTDAKTRPLSKNALKKQRRRERK